jgi:hypothetical protein
MVTCGCALLISAANGRDDSCYAISLPTNAGRSGYGTDDRGVCCCTSVRRNRWKDPFRLVQCRSANRCLRILHVVRHGLRSWRRGDIEWGILPSKEFHRRRGYRSFHTHYARCKNGRTLRERAERLSHRRRFRYDIPLQTTRLGHYPEFDLRAMEARTTGTGTAREVALETRDFTGVDEDDAKQQIWNWRINAKPPVNIITQHPPRQLPQSVRPQKRGQLVDPPQDAIAIRVDYEEVTS